MSLVQWKCILAEEIKLLASLNVSHSQIKYVNQMETYGCCTLKTLGLKLTAIGVYKQIQSGVYVGFFFSSLMLQYMFLLDFVFTR